jgi:hypothetical protein
MNYSSAFNGVSTTPQKSVFEKTAMAIPFQKESVFLDYLSYHQISGTTFHVRFTYTFCFESYLVFPSNKTEKYIYIREISDFDSAVVIDGINTHLLLFK